MRIHFGLEQLPLFNNTVITVGTFDGVHAAHQKIISLLNNLATSINGESVLITFHPHPKHVLQSNQRNLQLLSTPDEKIELLKNTSLNHLVIIPFTQQFASQSASNYIEHFLVEKFHPKKIVIGFNHHFGNNRHGNSIMLNELSKIYGFEVFELEQQIEAEVTISSTTIRTALQKGDITEANRLLNHPYLIMGSVVYGKQLGRTIGFPTANIEPLMPEKLIAKDGVYAVEVRIHQQLYKGMLNIGVKPTINGTKRSIEVHILNFDGDIYHQTIKVFLHHYIRAEQKFNGLDELKQQIEKDKQTTIQFFELKNNLPKCE